MSEGVTSFGFPPLVPDIAIARSGDKLDFKNE